ncbi:hypothetical protein STEG23_011762 [Scotinomys teguina]
MAAPGPGQLKVQPKDAVGTRTGFSRYKWEFKDSNKEFWMGGHAVVKILTLSFVIAGFALLESIYSHPLLLLVLNMEVSFISFFIFLNTFAIHRYMPFIYWPVTLLVSRDPSVLMKTSSQGGHGLSNGIVTNGMFVSSLDPYPKMGPLKKQLKINAKLKDIFNDLFSCVFLIGAIVFAVKSIRVVHEPFVIGLILCLLAAILCLIDALLIIKNTRNNMKTKP